MKVTTLDVSFLDQEHLIKVVASKSRKIQHNCVSLNILVTQLENQHLSSMQLNTNVDSNMDLLNVYNLSNVNMELAIS